MLASALRYTINIYQVTTARNTTGEAVPTETLLKTKRAGVKYTGGNESQQADQRTETVKIRFQIRYDSTLSATMIVGYNSEKFDIKYIEKINRTTMFLHTERINKKS